MVGVRRRPSRRVPAERDGSGWTLADRSRRGGHGRGSRERPDPAREEYGHAQGENEDEEDHSEGSVAVGRRVVLQDPPHWRPLYGLGAEPCPVGPTPHRPALLAERRISESRRSLLESSFARGTAMLGGVSCGAQAASRCAPRPGTPEVWGPVGRNTPVADYHLTMGTFS